MNMATLTPAQRKAILEVWSVPGSNPTEFGEELILTFIEKYPIYRDYFPMFKDKPRSVLRAHGERTAAAVVRAVGSLSDENYMETFEKVYGSIGETHNTRGITRQAFMDLNEVIRSIIRRMVPTITAEQGEAMKLFEEIVHNIIFSKLDD